MQGWKMQYQKMRDWKLQDWKMYDLEYKYKFHIDSGLTDTSSRPQYM